MVRIRDLIQNAPAIADGHRRCKACAIPAQRDLAE